MQKTRLHRSFAALMALIMSVSVVTSLGTAEVHAASKKPKTKTVYAISSFTISTDYSNYVVKELRNKKYRYKRTLKYTKKGLLKKMSSNANPKKFGSSVTGDLEYTYKGKKLKTIKWSKYEPAPYMDDRYYLTTFNYKNGKLKSSKNAFIMLDDDYGDDSFKVNYKLDRNGRITKGLGYKYDKNGRVIKAGGDILYNDEYGYPVKCKFIYRTIQYQKDFPFGTGDLVENNAVNKYKNGRLIKTVMTDFSGEKETVKIKYKKIKIPASYYKTFKAQQYDIIFNYVYLGFNNQIKDPQDLPIGFGKVK